MDVNEVIVWILMFCMVLGGLDRAIGNKFGLGEKFEEGFMALGPLALAMVGVVSLAPVLAKILQPVIVPVYEAGEASDGPYFVMPLVRGGSLAKRLPEFQADGRAAAGLVAGVAAAVQHAHAKGFLHRDLKPGNILLTPDGKPLVSDFGLVKLLAEESDDVSSDYAAPADDTPPIDPPTAPGGEQAVRRSENRRTSGDFGSLLNIAAINFEQINNRRGCFNRLEGAKGVTYYTDCLISQPARSWT